MEFAETRDPLGFVGARVMRHSRRARRRRQRPSPSALPAAMKRDPGAAATDGDDEMDNHDDDDDAPAPALVLFGWLTRYDTRLDTYALFLPETGGVTLYSRSDVLQFVANPEFQLRTDRDDAFPPPVEDTNNRLVGTPLRKHTKSKKRRRDAAIDEGKEDEEEEEDEETEGRVVCYRPFADQYTVAYDDGKRVEMSEREVVDALIACAKRDQVEREARKKTKQAQADVSVEPTPVTRKRRRSQDLSARPDDVNNDDDEETEDDEPPPMSGDGVKTEPVAVRVGPSEREAAKREPSPTPFTPEPIEVIQPSGPTAPVAQPPAEDSVDPEPEYEFPDPDDDEPMELLPLDDDDDEDHDMNSINAALASIKTTTPLPPSSEVVDVMDDDDQVSVVAPPPSTTTHQSSWSTTTTPSPVASRPVYQYYVVRTRPHVATVPFDKRSMAFEFLRTELTRLLDAEECASLETSLVSDVMTNRDIKDRDAVRRFVETGGLVVINCVLNARAIDALARRHARYDRVLFVLKLLAMLPTPSEQQVMESSIGKTIGRFIKSRMSDAQTTPDAAMPKCIAQLAKWIKHKWIANMDRSKKPTGDAAAKKHMQRPMQGRPSGQQNDPEPIPRRSTASFPSRPPQVPSFSSASSSSDVLGAALASGASSPRHTHQQAKSSLKPDWMRQKETLTRTRFTINTDANAERQHYQRDRKDAAAAANARNPANDAGARGVYGRSQRLSFGPRWSVCEFFKDTPPSAVRRANASGGSHYRNLMARPKSILRKKSKYRGDLTF